jgi:hypothetical protein
MKCFPSPRRASTIQIVRPRESTAETQPQLHPALPRLSAMISQYVNKLRVRLRRSLSRHWISPRFCGAAHRQRLPMDFAKDPGSDVRANAQTALRARRKFFMRSANHKWQSCITSVLPFIPETVPVKLIGFPTRCDATSPGF